MRALGLLTLLLWLGEAAWAKQPWVPNGRRWQFMSAEQKFHWISSSMALARERGMRIKHDPLFYLVQVNAYYADPANAEVDLGNAIADIGLPLGDLTLTESQPPP